MFAFVLAGGLGTRLRPLTHVIPKPLLPVGGQPILEIILRQLAGAGADRVFISLGYKAELIRSYFGDGSRLGLRLSYVDEEKPMGTAGALGFVRDAITKPVLVMNGDLLTKLDFRAFYEGHRASGAALTIGVREDSYQIPFGVVEADGQRVQRIREKPVDHFLTSAGIYVLEPAVVRSIEPGVRLDVPDLINRLAAAGEHVRCHVISEEWIDIGAMPDFERANAEAEKWK